MGARAKIHAGMSVAIYGMSNATYQDDPCPVPSLTSSVAHVLTSKSARHAWSMHPRFGAKKRETSRSMEYGTIAHALLLGTEKELVVVQADDWKTKASRDLRDAARAARQFAVLQREVDEVADAVKHIRKQLKEYGVVLCGKSEVSVFWTEHADDGTAVQCRGRIDHLILEKHRAQIIDLKSARSAHPRSCQSHAYEYGYDIQAAAYRSAIRAIFPELQGREEFHFLFAELEEPYVVTPAEMDGSFRELGERRWRRAINRWAECTRTKKWPTYGRTILSAPPWALSQEEEFIYGEEVRRQASNAGADADPSRPDGT